jgi:acyl carrier protein
MKSTLELQLRSFIVDTFLFGEGGDSFGDDDSLLEKGILDSTGVLELVAYLVESFGFKVADDELIPDNFDSVNRLSAFVQRKQRSASRPAPETAQALDHQHGVSL